MTRKNNFYLAIINELRHSTNLTKIGKKLNISKQKLNHYLRQLKKEGYIEHKGKGWYEVTKKSKNLTNHSSFLKKDISRGHANVWNVNFKRKPEDWENRIEILKKKKVNFKLVGALKTTPRIKVLGRKVWLCNNHIRVFDKPKESYYGETAKESKNLALQEIKLIVGVLNRKLGTFLSLKDISFRKEHYALIKNDLAIEENRRGNIIRIKDEDGEWLLIDDSLEKGGELENIGKKAYKTNIPMQKWWNNHKKNNFEVTPTFILNTMNGIQQAVKSNQEMLVGVPKNMELLAKQIESHLALIKEYREENVAWRKKKTKEIRKEIKEGRQTSLSEF